MENKKVTIEPFNLRGDILNVNQSKIYNIAEKLNNGLKLTREEKNIITKQCNDNCFFKDSVPLLGVRFNFKDFLKTFVVKQYGQLYEINAIDKTSIRAMRYGQIEYIKELI